MVTYNWFYIECAKWLHLGRFGIVLCMNCGKKSLTQIANSCLSSLCLHVVKCLVKLNANGLVEFYLPSLYQCKLTLKNFGDFKDLRTIRSFNCYVGDSLFVDDFASFIGLFTASMFCVLSKVNFRERFTLSVILCKKLICILSLSRIGLSMSVFCILSIKLPCNDCYIPEYIDGDMRFKLGLLKIWLQVSSNPSCSSFGLFLSHITIAKENIDLDLDLDSNCSCKRVVKVVVLVFVSVSMSVTSQHDIVLIKVCGICSNCSDRKSCHYWNYHTLSMSDDKYTVAVFSLEIGLSGHGNYLHRNDTAFFFTCSDTSRLSKYILR